MNRNTHRCMAALLLALASACTMQTAYDSGQEWQKAQCRKLPDMAERQRCEKSAAVSYDQYQTEAQAVKRKPAP